MKILSVVLLALSVGALGLSAQTTVTTTTYTSGQTLTVSDPVSITTSGTVTVSSGADISYASSGTITLGAGFSVALGGVFHTHINADTDGDGMPEYWETTQGLNPRTADGTLDKDSDGLNNLTEYLLGTNANGNSSNPAGGTSIDLKIKQPN